MTYFVATRMEVALETKQKVGFRVVGVQMSAVACEIQRRACTASDTALYSDS